jgi:hypothetical protein
MHSPTAALSSQNLPGRCGNHAVLRFYLLHEPVIVAAAWVIVRWNVPALSKYPALELVSFAATLAIYELAVPRYRPTRFLFGMNPASPPQTAAQSAADFAARGSTGVGFRSPRAARVGGTHSFDREFDRVQEGFCALGQRALDRLVPVRICRSAFCARWLASRFKQRGDRASFLGRPDRPRATGGAGDPAGGRRI